MDAFPRYWSFLRGIQRSPVNSPHKGQWRGALIFSLICALNKWLSKQSRGCWFETPSCSLWRHCNVAVLLLEYPTSCDIFGRKRVGGLKWRSFWSCQIDHNIFSFRLSALVLGDSFYSFDCLLCSPLLKLLVCLPPKLAQIFTMDWFLQTYWPVDSSRPFGCWICNYTFLKL